MSRITLIGIVKCRSEFFSCSDGSLIISKGDEVKIIKDSLDDEGMFMIQGTYDYPIDEKDIEKHFVWVRKELTSREKEIKRLADELVRERNPKYKYVPCNDPQIVRYFSLWDCDGIFLSSRQLISHEEFDEIKLKVEKNEKKRTSQN